MSMKVFIACSVLLVAIISRLSVPLDGKLGEKEAVIALPVQKCYQHVSNVNQFPKWMVAIKSIEPGRAKQFITTTDWGFLGTMSHDSLVVTADGNENFTFDIDNSLKLRLRFHVTSLGSGKCRFRLTVESKTLNMFTKYLVQPIARLYYTNWLTHSLLNFQLIHS